MDNTRWPEGFAADLRIAFEYPDAHARTATVRPCALDELMAGRYWWHHTR